MRKANYLLLVILVISILLPFKVNAAVKADTFKETVEEEISTFSSSSDYADYISKLKKADFSNYKEGTDKVNVYIFRGSTCSYCLKAVTYFTTILPTYGKYFNLVSYEVWNNNDNSNLLNQVASAMGDDVSGVPYIVIGNKSFVGFSESMTDQLISQIDTEYKASEKYDVMSHLGESKESDSTTDGTQSTSSDTTTSTNNTNNSDITVYAVMFVVTIGLVVYINYKYNKLALLVQKK